MTIQHAATSEQLRFEFSSYAVGLFCVIASSSDPLDEW